ncbi:hypothetical protein D3C73_887990 [compost metagenome]
MLSGNAQGTATVTLNVYKDGYSGAMKSFDVRVIPAGVGWEADLTDLTNWKAGYVGNDGGIQVSPVNGGMDGVRLTVTPKANPIWQPFYTHVKVNLDETSLLQINVLEAKGNWTVKVGTPEMETEAALKPEDSSKGVLTFDLKQVPALKDWKGEKEFTVSIYLIGVDSSILLKSLRFGNDNINQPLTQ